MKITYSKPSECLSFGAWLHWETRNFIRFFGIELDFKKEPRKEKK